MSELVTDMRRLWSDLGLIKMFEPSVNLWIQSPVLLSLLLLKKHVLIWRSSRITTRHWLDFMSKPVIKITLRKIFRCSNDFSWLMTGQTHLLYSDLPKAPGLPQGLSTNRIIGIIYTTHKLINDHPSKEVKCRKPIYLYTNQIHMTLPSKTLIWWIRRQKDKRGKKNKKNMIEFATRLSRPLV